MLMFSVFFTFISSFTAGKTFIVRWCNKFFWPNIYWYLIFFPSCLLFKTHFSTPPPPPPKKVLHLNTNMQITFDILFSSLWIFRVSFCVFHYHFSLLCDVRQHHLFLIEFKWGLAVCSNWFLFNETMYPVIIWYI